MSAEEKSELRHDTIKDVLNAGLVVADPSLDTWIVKEDGKFCVDGTGFKPVEEDFDDAHKAIEYFLRVKDDEGRW